MILKTIIILIILYFALEFGLFYYKYHHLPILAKIDQSDKTFGSGPELRYIATGDSTAVGVGASNTENTYPYAIAQSLAKDHKVIYKNIAVNGYKSSDVLQNQVSQIIAFKPDIVTISMGANDATHLVSGDNLLNNYKSVIAQLEAGTGAKIYITDIANFHGANLLPWFYISLLEFRSKYLNPELLKLDDDRLTIINIHDFGDYGQGVTKGIFSADSFHPNDKGYVNWTNAFLEKIGQ